MVSLRIQHHSTSKSSFFIIFPYFSSEKHLFSNTEDMEGHIPQVSEAAGGFLSAAHLRSEEYWRDLLGLDDEHQVGSQIIVGVCRRGENYAFFLL